MLFLVAIKCEVKFYELHNENDKKAIKTNIDWSKYSTALTWNCRKSVHSKLIVIFLFFFFIAIQTEIRPGKCKVWYSRMCIHLQSTRMILVNWHLRIFYQTLSNSCSFMRHSRYLSYRAIDCCSIWTQLSKLWYTNVFWVCQRKFDVPKIENCPFNLERVTRNCT